ncbi:hypothetical protein ACLK19_08500 [Escherichia coli]
MTRPATGDDVQRPSIWSPATTLVLDHPVATCLCALRLAGASLTHGRCCCGLVAVVVGTLYGSLSGYLGGKVDSATNVSAGSYSFPFMFFVILLVTFFGQISPAHFRGDRHGFLLDMARIVRGQP